MVGDDVLAHVALGNEAFRYDRGLHVFGAVLTVLVVAALVKTPAATGAWVVLFLAIGSGLAVEAVELLNAVAIPTIFSYDLVDSSLDIVGNAVGLIIGFVAITWTRPRLNVG